ncbi:ABC transporter substrate-binding protein [Bifidobacterium sp. UBA744]|uniref:ABC transporter substrate-binding protein n=1 Tax=Bifidobacterium sp. UBA744 TaxID=1946112 RepID=UPI0025B82DAF|nr:ABC transporter substrate-binding protein [Bifidobacterium sp. UBA744]
MARWNRAKRTLTAMSAALASLFCMAGCGTAVQNNSLGAQASQAAGNDVLTIPADGKKIQEGGTLTLTLSSDPDKLDPTTTSSLASTQVLNNICQPLYTVDASGSTVPLLAAAEPKISEDGKTYTFAVKQGVKFADGTDLNADAVVKTLERNLNLQGSARKSDLGPISQVKALDESTVEIDLSEPYAPLVSTLAGRAGMIMSPKALDESGDDFGTAPVCVGPFKFDSRVSSTSVTLVKDPNYYDAANVHLDKVVYKVITDSAIRTQNLKSGDVQLADNLTPQDVVSVKDDDSLTVMSAPSYGYQALEINIANTAGVGKPGSQIDTPIAKQKVVRQALAMSIDRDQLVESVFGGLYSSACSFVSDSTPFASESSKTCLPHDPAKAKQMLEDAGVTTPYTVKVSVANSPAQLQVMQAIQSQAKEGGFDIQIEPAESTTVLSNLNAGKYDVTQLGWSGSLDADQNVSLFLQSNGSMNFNGYANRQVDQLLDQAKTTADTSKRAELYGQVADLIREDSPIIYLYRMRYLTAVSSQVAGVSVYGDGIIRLANAALVER